MRHHDRDEPHVSILSRAAPCGAARSWGAARRVGASAAGSPVAVGGTPLGVGLARSVNGRASVRTVVLVAPLGQDVKPRREARSGA